VHNVGFEAVRLEQVPAQPVFLVNTRAYGSPAAIVGRGGRRRRRRRSKRGRGSGRGRRRFAMQIR